MRDENIPELAIRNFKHYYSELLEKGKSGGLIRDREISPVDDIPHSDELKDGYKETGRRELSRTVMIKLNGGLGTSMGLNKAKSLLKVKDGLSFLEIIIKQATRDDVALVLMDSFRTRKDSMHVIQQHPELEQGVPFDFLQHKVPKILQEDLTAAKYPQGPEHEWCPPGHGDIYNALQTSGMLNRLLGNDYEFAFVSNSDNLGGVIDTSILGYFAEQGIPFMMEVAQRTPADKKGGHLAQREDDRLILREIAQCPKEDIDNFQNITKYKYFNTNNLWLNLKALKNKIEKAKNGFTLPMICNEKHLNPRDSSSPKVFQLETAMGAAISKFDDSQAMQVPKNRFLPVKKTNSLLNIRSDNYILNEKYEVVENPDREFDRCDIDLDPVYYKLIDDLESRFPYGPPSLLKCKALLVKGDVKFGENINIMGTVTIWNSNDSQKKIENMDIKENIKL
ncbi:MAG: UTP--glucose-1-phosphate uridylyltransferase [Candidatus Marinimicrobia bacterium]|nr:UTP--glucose-1-phosphate uridylyltransferase [Candidatus Neomarinimicrobiota bacterium]